ncbi:MAG: SOS response-associated peptidase [Alphaproteobacteria bacterium]|nr:SOS response-associated peptidase [Alphaproteobacteria bacterium]
MCGRYSLTAPASVIAEIFEVDVLPEVLPRYNVAPSQSVPVIVEMPDQDANGEWSPGTSVRTLQMFKWGLIPFWAKDAKIAYKTINARGETVESKPAFRSSFKKRRCLIIADGFYEWKRLSKTHKIPHHIQTDGKPFAMAGLWAKWTDPATGEDVLSCSIVTTGPNALMESIHDRMPVILEKRDWDAWLSPDTPVERLKELIRPFPAEQMKERSVSSFVNNARNQGPECQADYVEE